MGATGSRPAAEYLGLFAEQRVCGVLVTPADATSRNPEAFRRHRIPFVLVDRVASGTGTCAVSVDDVRGGALAAGHRVSAGHHSVAYVSGPGEFAEPAAVLCHADVNDEWFRDRRTEYLTDDRTPERIVFHSGVGELPAQKGVLIANGARSAS